MKRHRLYDVFLSYQLADGDVAKQVQESFEAAGLRVFGPDAFPASTKLRDSLWKALAESEAVVVVFDADRLPASSTAVEIGAAMAWHKPIYLINTSGSTTQLPDYLSDYSQYPVTRIDDVVDAIRRSGEPISDDEQSYLRDIYLDMGIAADVLIGNPAAIDELARRFKKRSKVEYSAERLAMELIRLRKRGTLPRITKAPASTTA